MPSVAVNIAALLVLILPGFLSYRFVVLRSADPSQRSPLWQLSEMLEHSLYVHLIGVALIVLVHFTLEWSLGLSSYAAVLLQKGPHAFLNSYFSEAVLWFTFYPVYVIIASTILGAYNVPGKVSATITRLMKRPAVPQEPVWYYAFTALPNNGTSKLPHVFVKLKSGDVYYGEVASYPIALDTERGKDFLLRDTIYYKEGNPDNGVTLSQYDGIGAVLLNTVNVDSIILYYEDISLPEEEPV